MLISLALSWRIQLNIFCFTVVSPTTKSNMQLAAPKACSICHICPPSQQTLANPDSSGNGHSSTSARLAISLPYVACARNCCTNFCCSSRVAWLGGGTGSRLRCGSGKLDGRMNLPVSSRRNTSGGVLRITDPRNRIIAWADPRNRSVMTVQPSSFFRPSM